MQVVARNIQCLKKPLGRRKDSKELKTIGAQQKNYMNHQTNNRCEISLTSFYYCFNYNKLHVYQCIILRYQCIKYCYIYNILCFNVSNFVYQCTSQQVKRRQTLRCKSQNKKYEKTHKTYKGVKSTSLCIIIVLEIINYICINVINYGYQCIQFYALGGTHQFICNYASNCMYQYRNHQLKKKQTWMTIR